MMCTVCCRLWSTSPSTRRWCSLFVAGCDQHHHHPDDDVHCLLQAVINSTITPTMMFTVCCRLWLTAPSPRRWCSLFVAGCDQHHHHPDDDDYCLLQAVINSTITPTMMFTKTSQKFGQWSDMRANTVYGLGFSTEAELNKVTTPSTTWHIDYTWIALAL